MSFCRARGYSLGLLLAILLSWSGSSRSLAVAEGVAPQAPVDEAVAGEFFEKKVRPILVARCFECHNGEMPEAKGGLRLHSLAASLKGGDTGPAIIPGDPEKSLLIDAINYGDVYQMPPRSKMPADEIEILTTWVKQGAYWPKHAGDQEEKKHEGFDLVMRKNNHWCWQEMKRTTPPVVKNSAWVRDPLDQYIVAKLEEAGLVPLPATTKAVLFRRACFDVTGLPPTPAQMQQFLEDQSPQAFEKAVDRLLESPHFGERFARHWMDLVRYAESRGHEFDYTVPNAHQYRDYLIRAFNQDVPYDQIAREHIAGDLLKNPRRNADGFDESILGTGFWFFGEWVHSPVDIRKDETDRFDNMLDVFSKTFVGLTVACARCHDHKFDAISQADYYALAGFLQSSSYRLARFDTQEQHQKVAASLSEVDAAYRGQLSKWLAAQMQSQQAALIERLAAAGVQQLQVERMELANAAETQVILDMSASDPVKLQAFCDGPSFEVVPVGALEMASERIAAENPATPFPKFAKLGAFTRDATWKGLALAPGSENEAGRLGGMVRSGKVLKTKTFSLQSGVLHYLVRGSGHAYAAVDSHTLVLGPLHGQIVLDTGGDSATALRWVSHDMQPYRHHNMHVEFMPRENEHFEVLAVVDAAAVPKLVPQENASVKEAGVLQRLTEKLSTGEMLSAEAAALANWSIDQMWAGIPEAAKSELQKLRQEYAANRRQLLDGVKMESRVAMAIWEGSPQDEHLLIRGNAKTVGAEVPARFLSALIPTEDAAKRSGRLELAEQVTDPKNPLFARVMVNRLWHHLFGRGIVPSCDNMGVLGQGPSHPELLDHLAIRFVEEGYSIKRMIRTLILSVTYQQASSVEGIAEPLSEEQRGHWLAMQAKAAELDPENRLLHRVAVRRLQGEVIRDSLLSVSGRLNEKAFGPSVNVHLSEFMQGRGRPADGPVDGDGRRSLYISIRRNFLSPMMLAFDVPIPFSTMGKRNVSNVPAQALILLNDPLVVSQANQWAQKMMKELPTASRAQRIEHLYQSAFARSSTPQEQQIAEQFLIQQAAEYQLPETAIDADVRPWTDLCHALFNTKEFIFLQ